MGYSVFGAGSLGCRIAASVDCVVRFLQKQREWSIWARREVSQDAVLPLGVPAFLGCALWWDSVDCRLIGISPLSSAVVGRGKRIARGMKYDPGRGSKRNNRCGLRCKRIS